MFKCVINAILYIILIDVHLLIIDNLQKYSLFSILIVLRSFITCIGDANDLSTNKLPTNVFWLFEKGTIPDGRSFNKPRGTRHTRLANSASSNRDTNIK